MGGRKRKAFARRLAALAAVVAACACTAALLASCGGKPEVVGPERHRQVEGFPVAKPVIYLYPEEECELEVTLSFDGELACVYPAFAEARTEEDRDGGVWRVVARPDSTIADPSSGREFGYLFWEGPAAWRPDVSRGFCVAGTDTEAFLEDALARLGLSDREACDFITYWLPRMQENAYNLVSFQGASYSDAARLEVDPAPDSVVRVFMAWLPLSEPVDVEPQELAAPERVGFTVVEWGGVELAAE